MYPLENTENTKKKIKIIGSPCTQDRISVNILLYLSSQFIIYVLWDVCSF